MENHSYKAIEDNEATLHEDAIGQYSGVHRVDICLEVRCGKLFIDFTSFVWFGFLIFL